MMPNHASRLVLLAALAPATDAMQLGGAAAGGLAEVLVAAALRYLVILAPGLLLASWILERSLNRVGSRRG